MTNEPKPTPFTDLVLRWLKHEITSEEYHQMEDELRYKEEMDNAVNSVKMFLGSNG